MSSPNQNEIRLIYASQATGRITLDNLISIQETSRRNNSRSGVTGLLCHGNGRYLQVLEGEEERVRSLYETIARDPRHDHHRLIDSSPSRERLFGRWAMSCVQLGDSADQPVHVIVHKFFGDEPFLPETMGAADALSFLRAIASVRRDAQLDF